MKKFRMFTMAILCFCATTAFAQGNPDVEMADVLRSDGKIYAVVFGLVVILTGLIYFVLRVERKLVKLESELREKK